ncbi:MAG: T9SS type A sorting domain-containing protein, partial [Bacteroidota bacterium]
MYVGTGEVYNVFQVGTGAAYRNTRGSYGIGILKSTDGGVSWELSLDWTAEQTRGIWAIRVDENNPNIVWAATTNGLYKSEDAGGTWEQKLDVVMGNDLLINPNNSDELVAGMGNFNTEGAGIYYTENGGENWNKVTDNLPDTFNGKIQLALSLSEPDVIWASIGNGFGFNDGATWLCKSTDFGKTWDIVNQTDYSRWQGWFSHDVAINPNNGNDLVAIGIEIWRSTNGGQFLDRKTVGGIGFSNPPIGAPDGNSNFVHSDAHDVIYHPENSNIVYVACDGGIYRSENGGTTWRSLNGGYQTAQFYNGFSTSQNDPNFCLGGLQDNGTWVWNGDLSWRNVWGGDGAWTAIDPMDDRTFFASSQFLNVARLRGSSGIRLNVPSQSPTAFIAPYVIDQVEGNTIYAASSVIHKSTNQGITWTLTDASLFGTNPVLSMEVSPENADIVYAATAPFAGNRGGAYVTLDGGESWEDITQNLPDRYPMDITVDPNDPAVAYITYSGFETGHVFRTEDYGATWRDISQDLPDVPTNAVIVDPMFSEIIYVGNDIGVFYSINAGETWESYQEGLPNAVMVFDLKISSPNRKLRIVTHGNGAFQRDLLDGAVSSSEDLAIANLKVFPNPFQEVLYVEYELDQAENVELSLMDAGGRVVRTASVQQRAKGSHQASIDGQNLNAGIYFLKIKMGEKVLVKKIVKLES